MMLQNKYNKANFQPGYQKGATLITVLVFLTVMTLVSVTATKISILDVLASGNEQQQILLFQQAENSLKKSVTVRNLAKPMMGTDNAAFDANTGVYIMPQSTDDTQTEVRITDRHTRYYPCGSFNGKAVSLSASGPICDLYDFSVKESKANSSARDVHHRGVGKEKPNPKKNSYL